MSRNFIPTVLLRAKKSRTPTDVLRFNRRISAGAQDFSRLKLVMSKREPQELWGVCISVTEGGDITDIHVSWKRTKQGEYILRVRQFHHPDTKSNFRKRINTIFDLQGKWHWLALLKYFFEGEVKKVNLDPHSSAQNCRESYKRTRPSVVKKLKTLI